MPEYEREDREHELWRCGWTRDQFCPLELACPSRMESRRCCAQHIPVIPPSFCWYLTGVHFVTLFPSEKGNQWRKIQMLILTKAISSMIASKSSPNSSIVFLKFGTWERTPRYSLRCSAFCSSELSLSRQIRDHAYMHEKWMVLTRRNHRPSRFRRIRPQPNPAEKLHWDRAMVHIYERSIGQPSCMLGVSHPSLCS